MNIKVFSISLFFLSFLQPLLAQKATRIAYVDMNYILANMDEYKVASEQLAQKVAQWEQEIAQKQAEINTRREKLEAEKPLLTPETIKDKEEEIQVLTQNLEDYKQKRSVPKRATISPSVGAWCSLYRIRSSTSLRRLPRLVSSIIYSLPKMLQLSMPMRKNDITKVVLRLLKRKDNAEDRNKEISTLLKENLGVDYKTEKQRKQEKIKEEKAKTEKKTEARKVRNERTR